MTFTKSFFSIEGFEGSIFEGNTKGDTWKDWDCPYFIFDQAWNVKNAFNSYAGYEAIFDKDTDTFYFSYEGKVEGFNGENVFVDGKPVHVYAIGSYSWKWCEIKNVSVFDYDDYFGGKVILAYTDTGKGWLDVKVWIFNETSFYWVLQVPSDRIRSHNDLLLELKKEYYINEGSSVTI